MPRPPNPDLIRTIKNIVAAEIQKKGVDGLSLRYIAKCAGITPATIYYYFDNKEGLLNAIKLSVVQEMDECILSRIQPDAPPLKQVEDLIRTFIAWSLKWFFRRCRPKQTLMKQPSMIITGVSSKP